MTLVVPLFLWILQFLFISSVLLVLGTLAARIIREPADRLRVIQGTLAATGVAILLSLAPSTWQIAVPVKLPFELPSLPTELPAEPLAALPTPNNLSQSPAEPPLEFARPYLGPAGPRPELPSTHGSAEVAVATPPSRSAAVVADSPRFRWSELGSVLVVLAYGAGSLITAVRWLRARWRLQQLYRASRSASSALREQFARLAGSQGASVQLRTSSQIATPITWGLFRPVILLPEDTSPLSTPSSIAYSLAHEWAHVARQDAWTWQLALTLQLFLWCHPLYWSIRRSLLVTMDQLADAEAARQGSSAADYAEFLVGMARYGQTHPSRLALGVTDKHSQLRQRVVFLLETQGVVRGACSPLRSVAIGSLAVLLSILVTIIRIPAPVEADETGGAPSAVNQVGPPASASPAEAAAPAPADASPAAPAPADAASADAASAEDKSSKSAPDQLPKGLLEVPKMTIASLLETTMQQKPDGSITYNGFVTDAVTEIPIQGATVKVYHKLSKDPQTGGWSTLEITEHTTNMLGMYSFTLPPEQASESSLYIEVEAQHPNYASQGRAGYSHSMIRKNLELGELPFYTQLKLWPGEAIEGTIVSPTGEALPGVKLVMYAASDRSTSFPRGSFSHSQTDAQGRFRVVAPTPGDGILWITPPNFSPQAHRIRDRRGDWGTLKTEHDATITGTVVDVDGNPVPNVRISARRNGDGEEIDDYLQNNQVANQIGRNVVSDANGQFTLASLPDGDYSLEVEPNSAEDNYDPTPLKEVFLRQTVKLADSSDQRIALRAVPHVLLQGTYLNSKNEPTSGHEVMLTGRIDDSFYFARSSRPGNDGKFELKIPHGMRETSLDLITNEHGAIRWRKSHEQPLQRGRNVELGVVEDDIRGFEVVRYTAPILMVKAVDAQGQTVHDVTPVLNYQKPLPNDTMYVTGGHVAFEAQRDGRHRSSQLVPDEPFSITVKKEGYQTKQQELTLTEGEQRELLFELVPITEAPASDKE